jgi:hypothetical protein
MTNAWKLLSSAEKQAVEEAFSALSVFDDLGDGAKAKDEGDRAFGFSDVYAFATGLEAPTQALREALLRDRKLRADLDHLLDKVSLYRFPRVAAASSGAVDGRDGENYRIRIKVSRVAPEHTYVIIELDDPKAKAPAALFFRRPDGEYGVRPLPEPEDGAIQILADSSSDLVAALSSVETEVYLR